MIFCVCECVCVCVSVRPLRGRLRSSASRWPAGAAAVTAPGLRSETDPGWTSRSSPDCDRTPTLPADTHTAVIDSLFHFYSFNRHTSSNTEHRQRESWELFN